MLEPYQAARLNFTNLEEDPGGTAYNQTQSITAVGSGGLDGRGVQGATQTRLDYLPEHHTDFVFAALAEQRGFFGAALLLGLYLLDRLARPAHDHRRARRVLCDRRRWDRDRASSSRSSSTSA